MAKKPRIADPDAIRAARNAIAEAREKLKRAKSDSVTTIITGVPRRGRDGVFPDDYKWKPVKPPYYPKGMGPSEPKPPVEAEPPLPREWKYVWIQTRAPRSDSDTGEIAEAQYAITTDGVLYLDDMNGKPIASQKLRSDDNPLHVAARLLRDRGRNNSSVAGFYADIPNNGRETYH